MNILKETSTELTIGKRKKIFIPGLFLAIFLLIILFGGLAILGSMKMTKLLCERPTVPIVNSNLTPSVDCRIIQLNFKKEEISTTSIFRLREAKLETTDFVTFIDESDQESTNYRVVLLTNKGELIFESSPFNSSENLRVSAINSFINDSSKKIFEITADYKGINNYLLALVILFILLTSLGLSSLAKIPPDVICRFDKNTKKIILKYSDDLVLQHSMEEIQDIFVEENNNNYRVILTLISGERLPLTYIYSSGQKEKEQIVNSIQKFLGMK